MDRWNLRVLLRKWLLRPSKAELRQQAEWDAEWERVIGEARELLSRDLTPPTATPDESRKLH